MLAPLLKPRRLLLGSCGANNLVDSPESMHGGDSHRDDRGALIAVCLVSGVQGFEEQKFRTPACYKWPWIIL